MNELFETVAPGLGNPFELLSYVYNNAWIDWYQDPGEVLTTYDLDINAQQDTIALRHAWTPRWAEFSKSMILVDAYQDQLRSGAGQPGGVSAADLNRLINAELGRWK
jgi:hypothetical protein